MAARSVSGWTTILTYELEDAECDPLFFVPMVDFTKLKANSIIDDF